MSTVRRFWPIPPECPCITGSMGGGLDSTTLKASALVDFRAITRSNLTAPPTGSTRYRSTHSLSALVIVACLIYIAKAFDDVDERTNTMVGKGNEDTTWWVRVQPPR